MPGTRRAGRRARGRGRPPAGRKHESGADTQADPFGSCFGGVLNPAQGRATGKLTMAASKSPPELGAGPNALGETAQGLHIVDPSQRRGARLYTAPWNVDPEKGVEAEARLKASPQRWGVALSRWRVKKASLSTPTGWSYHAGVSAAFNTADAFHTYRVRCQATISGVGGRTPSDRRKGKFTAPAHRAQPARLRSGARPRWGGTGVCALPWRQSRAESTLEDERPKAPGLEIVPGEVIDLARQAAAGMFKRGWGDLSATGARGMEARHGSARSSTWALISFRMARSCSRLCHEAY